jgi:hypothetical protein
MLTGYGYAPVANSVWNCVRLKPEGSIYDPCRMLIVVTPDRVPEFGEDMDAR